MTAILWLFWHLKIRESLTVESLKKKDYKCTGRMSSMVHEHTGLGYLRTKEIGQNQGHEDVKWWNRRLGRPWSVRLRPEVFAWDLSSYFRLVVGGQGWLTDLRWWWWCVCARSYIRGWPDPLYMRREGGREGQEVREEEEEEAGEDDGVKIMWEGEMDGRRWKGRMGWK